MYRHTSVWCGKINTNFELCAVSKEAFRKFHHLILNLPPEAQRPQLGLSLLIWCGKAPCLSFPLLCPQSLSFFPSSAPKSPSPSVLLAPNPLFFLFPPSVTPSLFLSAAAFSLSPSVSLLRNGCVNKLRLVKNVWTTDMSVSTFLISFCAACQNKR